MSERSSVLLVDDEPGLAELYATWLGHAHETTVVTSGGAALDVADEDTDVVLLDRRMPGMDGESVLRELRARELDCRVALVSAVEPDVDVVALGFDAYLVKPVTQAHLVETVETLLARRGYSERVHELFGLEHRRRLLERRRSDAELSESETYRQLLDDIDHVRSALEASATDFDAADFRAAIGALPVAGGGRS